MWSTSFKSAILISVLYILAVLLLPIIFLLFLPVLLIRKCVSLLGQCFGGGSLGKILTTSATSHACFEERGTCILPLTLKGIPDVEHIRNEFTFNILNAKDSSGQLQYPELKQTVVSWGGYLFWKDVPDFQFPIRLLDVGQGVDLDSPAGLELLRSFYGKEWKFGEGLLWELVIIPGLEGNFSLAFVIHHALGDALSLLKVIDKLSNPAIIIKKERVKTSPQTSNPLLMIRTLFRIPYDIALHIKTVMQTHITSSPSSHENINKIDKESPNSKLSLASTSFYLPDLKRIAKTQRVSVTALIMSAVQGSLQRIWTGNSLLYFPTLDPKHPQKLRNMGGSGYVELVDKQAPAERLQKMEKQLQNLRFSTFPLFAQITGTLSGSLPPCLLRRIIHGAAAENLTFFLSPFILSRHSFSLFGYPVLRVVSMGSGHAGTKVVAFFAFSTVDCMAFTVMGDEGVVNDEDAKSILHGVAQEFEIFENLDMESIEHVSVTISK